MRKCQLVDAAESARRVCFIHHCDKFYQDPSPTPHPRHGLTPCCMSARRAIRIFPGYFGGCVGVELYLGRLH